MKEEIRLARCGRTSAGCIILKAAVLILLLSKSPVPAAADPEGIAAIMRLLGTEDPEELDQYTVEQLNVFLVNPLHINFVSRSRLASSGLFTPYQVASIVDYRERNGDVLSFAELALVDGFNEEMADALRPFVSLDSRASPGKSSVYRGEVRNMLTIRSSGKYLSEPDEPGDYSYGLKYRLSLDDRLEFGMAANRAYNAAGNALPDAGTFYLACYGRKALGKIVIGDYNLRYGQGLALWSGFSMSGVSYPQSFFRRPSGISPYLSFSGAGGYRGVAADFNVRRFTVSVSTGIGGLKEMMQGEKPESLSLAPAVNVGWLGRNAQASFTLCGETAGFDEMADGRTFSSVCASADFRWCVKGVDLYGEAAIDMMSVRASAIAGTAFRAGENVEIAFSGRYLPDEYGISSGGKFYAGRRVSLAGREGFGSTVQRHTGTFCLDAVYYPFPKYSKEDSDAWQLKVQADYSLQAMPCLAIVFRLSERLRSAGEKNRTELRCDLVWTDGTWRASMRLDACRNRDVGLLSYVEGGYAGKIMTAYLRAGAFSIDSWQDRIYVYERDAPGNFNVPAYYGRGCWGACTIGIKAARKCRLYLRLSTLQYPWDQISGKERQGKTEGKVQLVLDL